jgi:hypothetical protein
VILQPSRCTIGVANFHPFLGKKQSVAQFHGNHNFPSKMSILANVGEVDPGGLVVYLSGDLLF